MVGVSATEAPAVRRSGHPFHALVRRQARQWRSTFLALADAAEAARAIRPSAGRARRGVARVGRWAWEGGLAALLMWALHHVT